MRWMAALLIWGWYLSWIVQLNVLKEFALGVGWLIVFRMAPGCDRWFRCLSGHPIGAATQLAVNRPGRVSVCRYLCSGVLASRAIPAAFGNLGAPTIDVTALGAWPGATVSGATTQQPSR